MPSVVSAFRRLRSGVLPGSSASTLGREWVKITMHFILLAVAVAVSALAVADDQAQKLIDTIVALQRRSKIFGANSRGSYASRHRPNRAPMPPSESSQDAFSGTFIWRKKRRFLVRQLPRRHPGPSENRAPDRGRA